MISQDIFGVGVVVLVFALIINARSKNQTVRAVFAVIAAVIVPFVGSLLVGAPSELSATWYWILSSCVQICVCAFLAILHIKQLKQDAQSYGVHFKNQLNEPSAPEESSNKADVSIEGQSAFTILLWGIYGLAALLGSVFLYFAIAQFWETKTETKTFIFANNEGFIAALTLLIIVVSGAAVPIYTALAEQVRAQIDTFELQISDLHRAAVNVSDHANPLWSHFLSVSQAAISNWQLTREQVERGANDLLFEPFFRLKDGQSLDEVTDDELRRAKSTEDFIRYSPRVFQETKFRGFRTSYLKQPNLASSERRILKNQLFRMRDSVSDKFEQSVGEKEDELPFSDRLQRARRLRYLGWMAQGSLARAVTGEGVAMSALQPNSTTLEPYALLLNGPILKEECKRTPQQGLVPSSEDFILAVLNRSVFVSDKQSEEDSDKENHGDNREHNASSDKQSEENNNEDNRDVKRSDEELLAAEYRDRAKRHIEKWNSFLSPALVEACNSLDIDIGPLVDDVILLERLTDNKTRYREGTLARFFYYGLWLSALTDPRSRIFQLLSALTPAPDFDCAEDQQRVSDASDIRKKLSLLARRVSNFVKSGEPSRDLISDGVLQSSELPEGWLLDVLAFRLRFSKTWLLEVQWLGREELNPKQKDFLTWIVEVLGSPEDQANLENTASVELRERTLRLVAQSRFSAILGQLDTYCRDKAHDAELMDRFFGRDGQESREEPAQKLLDKWRESLELVPGTDFRTDRSNLNLTREFLLLTLADHKSALFNWMRAARAVEVREKVTDFQRALETQRTQSRRQLGIEIIPSRHDRLEHLRDYLGCFGFQKPLQVRSIYDLQPTHVERANELLLREEQNTYRRRINSPYRKLFETLNFSGKWKDEVRIHADIQLWVYQRMFQANKGPMPELVRSDRLIGFLRWIIQVLDPVQKQNLSKLSLEELLLLALHLVNPHVQRRHEQLAQPKSELPNLTEKDFDTRFNEIEQKVLNYCRDQDNAQDLQLNFFGLDNRAQERQAPQAYQSWYNETFPTANDT